VTGWKPVLRKNAMEGDAVTAQCSVLIVDQSEENREVLRTVLERHGVTTLTASRPQEGAVLARHHRPEVIVLDTEYTLSDLDVICGVNSENRGYSESSIILLGKLRRNKSAARSEFFSKPYHYGPLIRRIEEILENSPRKVA
jgi:DNA-binding response OmpR family regulator